MPRGVGFIVVKEIMQLLNDLIREVLIQPACDSAETLRSRPPHGAILVFEGVQQVLNDELQLFKVYLILLLKDVFFLLNRCHYRVSN